MNTDSMPHPDTSMPFFRAKNQKALRRAEAVTNVEERLAVVSAMVQLGQFTDEKYREQAELIVAAVLALTASGAR